MSVTINTGELKFSVFGKGFENTRNDSGEGGVTYEKRIGYGAGTACLDETSTYVWLTQNQGQAPLNYFAKVRISDLEQVEISNVIQTDIGTQIYHPSNVANNYGIALQNFGDDCDVYVFDLTTDEIYYHFTASISSFQTFADCIMVGDVFYFADRGGSNARVFKLDPINETFSEYGSAWFNNGAGCGFVDNDTLYAFNNPVWFSDYGRKYGYGLSGSTQWDVMAPRAGSGGNFPNCLDRGMGGNGYVWLASYVDGAWRWGAYDGNNGGDFVTPSPIRTVGNFGNTDPRYTDYHVYFTNGRTKCAYGSSALGLVLVDFSDDVKIVTDEYWIPLAVDDKYIVAIDQYVNNTYIFRYR